MHNPYPDLNNCVAIITGGSSGIGKGIALMYGRSGIKTVVNYYSGKEEATQVVTEIEAAGGEAIALQADVSKEEDVLSLFAETEKAFGLPDIVVNNAGIQKDAPFLEMTVTDWQKVMGVNLTGAFICAREAGKAFMKREKFEKSRGKIIFISSVHDEIPWAGHINYAASKGGMQLLMESVAQELAQHKIRVNSISPGAIKTAINEAVWSDKIKHDDVIKLIPYGRWGEAEDIGNAALWLASDQSDYVHGTTLYVDGGMTLYPSFIGNG